MALILLVKVLSRVFTAKCSEPQVGISNGMGEKGLERESDDVIVDSLSGAELKAKGLKRFITCYAGGLHFGFSP